MNNITPLLNALIKILFATTLISFVTSPLFAEVKLTTLKKEVRPQYPFPEFLSTGPYVWYEDAKNNPLKGHTFRVSTNTVNREKLIFIERVEFGNNGCCLEIVEYRQLVLDEQVLKQLFPTHTGIHGFKLTRWVRPEIFEFHAYGGNYRLSQINTTRPLLEELRVGDTSK